MPSGIYSRKNSIICICEICGGKKKTSLAKFKRFCSNKCKGVFRSKRNLETGNKPPSRTGIKDTLEQRLFKSERITGSKNWNWKGGIGRWRPKSLEYKLWREAVFKRDNWKCIWCGKKGNIEADHIKPFAYFPELRYAIDNGRTLCVPCHKTTDTYGGKITKLYKNKL